MTANQPAAQAGVGVIVCASHAITASQRQTASQPAQKPHRTHRNSRKKPHQLIQLYYGEISGLARLSHFSVDNR
jgi:hypothetical protein